LRQHQTDAENLLWYRLRNRQLLDLKFRRQRPIGKYIADFACIEIGLVIELDGRSMPGRQRTTQGETASSRSWASPCSVFPPTRRSPIWTACASRFSNN
jgi:very-short-patch-repair endonuclease